MEHLTTAAPDPRSARLLFLLSLGFAFLLVACSGDVGDDSGDDTSADTSPVDPCTLIARPCEAEGSRCDGAQVVLCTPDADGCLVESTSDCAAPRTCEVDPDSGAAACADPDPCASIEDLCDRPAQTCDDTTLVLCSEDIDGCLVERRTDCATQGATCDDSTPDAAVCAGVCDLVNDPCAASSRSCLDDASLTVCAADDNGCLVESTIPCPDDDRCVPDAALGARCAPPCDPACVDATPDTPRCNADVLETCTDLDADGCLDLVETPCAPGICDDSGAQPSCDNESVLVVGEWNFHEAVSPDTFTVIVPDGTVDIYRGFQFSWMVVIALRHRGVLAEPFDFDASITFEGGRSGGIQRVDLVFTQEDDGFGYFYDGFLDIGPDDAPPTGTPATLTVHVEDAVGVQADFSFSLTVGDINEL